MTLLIAYLHFFGIMGLVCVLTAELFLLRKPVNAEVAKLLQKFDIAYLGVAVLMLGSGIARVIYEKGPGYYLSNRFFIIKVSLFVVVGLISIIPTIHFLKWNFQLAKRRSLHVSSSELKKLRLCIFVQMGILVLIPLFAVLMANGVT